MENKKTTLVSRALLIVLLVASLACMTLYAREGEGGVLHTIQGGVESLVAPVKFVGASASSVVEGTGIALEDLTADANTLSGLREQNAALREQLVQAEEYRARVQSLQGLLGMRDTYSMEGVGGQVIGRSTDAWNQTITIDVGSDAGVTTGLTVMGPSGVVGQVVTVTPQSSTVRLLSDPQSGAAAMVQANRAEGIVRGSLDGLLYLENIGADVDLEIGDAVVTSGLGGSYTRGLLIGSIARIEGQSGDATRRIIVAPNGSIHNLEDVLVVFEAKGASLPSTDQDEEESSGDGTGGTRSSNGSGSTTSASDDSSYSYGDESGDES